VARIDVGHNAHARKPRTRINRAPHHPNAGFGIVGKARMASCATPDLGRIGGLGRSYHHVDARYHAPKLRS
jgi:hypothetical protein